MYRSSPCVCLVLGHAFLAISLTARVPAQLTLEQTSPAWISNPLELSVQGATPGTTLFMGISGALQDPPAPIAGGLYPLDPIVVGLFGVATAQGTGSVNIDIPNSPPLIGGTPILQVVDVTALALSNPISIWIGPPEVLDTPNPQLFGAFGDSVAVGDFLGTGDMDIAVGAGSETVSGVGGAGRVYVFEGPAFVNVTTITASLVEPAARFGKALAALDWNGDGNTDLAVGEPERDVPMIGPDAGRVVIQLHPVGSGGEVILTAPMPLTSETLGDVLAAADLGGDGNDELLAGAPHAGGGGVNNRRVVIFSNTGAQVVATPIPDPLMAGFSFGSAIAVGDANGGAPEILVGDSNYLGAFPNQGVAHLFDSGGGLITTIPNPAPAFGARFGRSVAIGDLTDDGTGDLLIGAMGMNMALLYPAPGFAMPVELPTVRTGDINGGRSVLIADINGDGDNDAVLASTSCNAIVPCGSISFYLGPSLVTTGFMTSAGVTNVLAPGTSLAFGDVDGNGTNDIVAGAPSSNPNFLSTAGRALIMR